MKKIIDEKENKMGVMPVNKLLLTMALPLMLSMLVQALYNVVDSIFVGMISQDAFNAVSLAFPLQNIVIAIGSGTGVGVNALIARSLGEKDKEKANRYAANGLFLGVVSGVAMVFVGLFVSEPFLRSQTDNPVIIEEGVKYLKICTCLSVFVIVQCLFERILQSTGKTVLSMYTQGIGAIVNIIFDPIFIFTFKMGVAGAAVATVLGQFCGMVAGILLNKKYNKELSGRLKGFKPNLRFIGNIYKIGLPSILMISVGSVMTYMMNKLLLKIEATETAAAVFNAYFKLQSFVIMPVIGLAQAMLPIVSFNYGAVNKKRMLATYKRGVLYALCVLSVGTLLMLFVPELLLKMFSASDEMLKMGAPAFRIISIAVLFASYGIVTSNFFQAVGNGVLSMFMSLIRQLIVLVPMAYLLGYTVGYHAVWWAIPIAEFVSSLLAVFGWFYIKRKILNNMPKESCPNEIFLSENFEKTETTEK